VRPRRQGLALLCGPSTSPLGVTVRWFTLERVAWFAAFAATAALWQYVYVRFGDAAGDRVWGGALLLTAAFWMCRTALPVSIGSFRTTLTGWRKFYILLPAALFGLTVALYPHETACVLHFRHRVCP
jgi:hypothetical protein